MANALATRLTPPRPRLRASTAAHNRNVASSRSGSKARYFFSSSSFRSILTLYISITKCTGYFSTDPNGPMAVVQPTTAIGPFSTHKPEDNDPALVQRDRSMKAAFGVPRLRDVEPGQSHRGRRPHT